MNKAVVIGSGAGGAMCARELQGKFQVTVLEAGREFQPFNLNLSWIEKFRKTGLLADAREIGWLFPAMRIRQAGADMILVSGHGSGGTTTISTGNALRRDGDLRALGIDLDEEFGELAREIPVFSGHQEKWRPRTRDFFAICRDMKLDPQAMPKMGDYARCRGCGRCVLGCPHGVKWDSRRLLDQARRRGARLLTSRRVERIVHEKAAPAACWARHGIEKSVLPGRPGRPGRRRPGHAGASCRTPASPASPGCSSIRCCAWPPKWKAVSRTASCPCLSPSRRKATSSRPTSTISVFSSTANGARRPGNIYSLMIKLADENQGGIARGRIQKTLTAADRERLEEAVATCAEMFQRAGVDKSRLFFGTLNAGHPGGMLPLTAAQAKTLHDPPAAGKCFRGRRQPVSRRPGQSAHPDHHGPGQARRQDMPPGRLIQSFVYGSQIHVLSLVLCPHGAPTAAAMRSTDIIGRPTEASPLIAPKKRSVLIRHPATLFFPPRLTKIIYFTPAQISRCNRSPFGAHDFTSSFSAQTPDSPKVPPAPVTFPPFNKKTL